MNPTTDKNQRPYLISIDWLQIHLRTPEGFNPNQPSLLGYHMVKLFDKSKKFADIYEVYEPDGVLIGELKINPTSPLLHKHTAIFKADNAILYEADLTTRLFNFIGSYGMKYKGITRIDVCYDSNELYGGLKHQTLINKYWHKQYLKFGTNEVNITADLGYKLSANAKGYKTIVDSTVKNGKPLGNLPEVQYQTVRWGNRASGVMVEIYNKTLEMQRKRMKHHIINAWKIAGIDPNREVYRIEISISKGGKQLTNLKTGKKFELQISDIMTQEVLEQIFADYAHKYFRFCHNSGMKNKQRMKEVRALCLSQQQVVRPQKCTKQRDYTKMHKVMLNFIDKMISANAELGNEIVKELETLKKATLRIYGLEKWYADARAEKIKKIEAFQQQNADEEDLYNTYLAGIPKPVAERAAKFQKQQEDRLKYLYEALEEDERDLTGLYERDLFD